LHSVARFGTLCLPDDGREFFPVIERSIVPVAQDIRMETVEPGHELRTAIKWTAQAARQRVSSDSARRREADRDDQPRRDLLLVGAGTVLFFAASVHFELSEMVSSWTGRWENYQLDEIPGTLLFLALALAWFGWRRVQEARDELRRRVATQERLAEALAENRRLSLSHVSVQEEERKQLARELHDELGQHLNAIKVNAVAIRGSTENKSADGHDAAAAIIAVADQLHGTIRGMLRRLRPVGLDELGLAAALEHLVQGWRARNPDVCARLRIAASVENLRENENIAIYRLVQEGLNNVSRHARAREVTVCLDETARADGGGYGKSDVVLTIADDGVGARGRDETGGLGLIGMRERIEGLHGRLAIEAASGRGFRITATIPRSSHGSRA
jgi:signal transduction histidine kinase